MFSISQGTLPRPPSPPCSSHAIRWGGAAGIRQEGQLLCRAQANKLITWFDERRRTCQLTDQLTINQQAARGISGWATDRLCLTSSWFVKRWNVLTLASGSGDDELVRCSHLSHASHYLDSFIRRQILELAVRTQHHVTSSRRHTNIHTWPAVVPRRIIVAAQPRESQNTENARKDNFSS